MRISDWSSDVCSSDLTPTIEILSKDDARAMFAMTKNQWHSNVYQAVSAGMARPMGTPETGYGMAMNTPDGDLLVVKPVYSKNELTPDFIQRSEEHTSELQSLMRISYAVFCLTKKHTMYYKSQQHRVIKAKH